MDSHASRIVLWNYRGFYLWSIVNEGNVRVLVGSVDRVRRRTGERFRDRARNKESDCNRSTQAHQQSD